jgi:aarF domain-containing kinase
MASVSEEDYDKYIKLQQSKRALFRFAKLGYNWTLGWLMPCYDLANKVGSESAENDIVVPLNAARLVNTLFRVHGHEVLVDGCFNADPHPGNILCAEGKLALIDYGQVKRLSTEQRLHTAKCILLVDAALKVDPRVNKSVDPLVHRRARTSVAAHARQMGMTTQKMLDDTFYDMMVVYMGRIDKPFLYPENAIQWTDSMQKRDPMGPIDKVDYFVMVNMTTLMLRGLAEMLGQPRNVAAEWAPIARQVLAQEGQLEEVDAEISSWTAIPNLEM